MQYNYKEPLDNNGSAERDEERQDYSANLCFFYENYVF